MRSLARSLAHVTERITHDDWADLAGPLIAALPYVSAFTLLDYVAGADRANWEANMTSEYSRNVSMLEFTVGKSVMPSRARYYVVAAVVGPAMGVLVPGRDAFDNPPPGGCDNCGAGGERRGHYSWYCGRRRRVRPRARRSFKS